MRGLRSVESADLTTLVRALRAALEGNGPAVLPLPTAPPAVLDALRAALRPDDPDAPLEAEDVAVVLGTSGSTGPPKGVLLTAAALAASARATTARLGGSGSWLLALDPGHVAGLQVVLRSLLTGSEPVPLGAGPFTPDAFAAAAARLDPGARRYTSLVPTQLRRLLADPVGRDALAAFDAVLVGGAATPAPLLAAARTADVREVTTYGMSETCGGCVYDGVPLEGVRVRLAPDARILLSGAVVARGYRLRPDLTAEAFDGSTFRTSDLGTLGPDGRLSVEGRLDDVVVSGGTNVALTAVEVAVLAHVGVREAAAFGRPDPEWGTRVELAVVPGPTAPVLADLADLVTAGLGRAAAPKRLHLLPALPLLPSGKLDRAALGNLPA